MTLATSITTAPNDSVLARSVSDSGPDDGTDYVEPEEEDENAIHTPFNPERIKISTKPMIVELLKMRYDHGELDLNPEFQRAQGIWDTTRRSRLIESLLLRIPIPVFYMAEDPIETSLDRLIVVDGVQRLSTIFDYMDGKFPLSQLQYLVQFDRLTFKEIPGQMQRRIRESNLTTNIIERSTPTPVMLNVFMRVNTGGRPLNAQEVRHAMKPGPVRGFLTKLANSSEFKSATQCSVRPIRMVDRELVLRFMAFRLSDWQSYSNRSFDDHLASTMDIINRASDKSRLALSDEFLKAMNAAGNILGEDAFRKPRGESGHRKPINKALFEVWSTQLASRDQDEISQLIRKSNQVDEGFRELINQNHEFNAAISYSTSHPDSVKTRHRELGALISRVLTC